MKRCSPEHHRDNAPAKKRPTVPLSPPRSQPSSPEVRRAAVLQVQQRLEREMGAKFQREYKEDIVNYMHELQNTTMSDPNLMDMQPELEWAMRPFLLDFLLEMHAGFALQPTTLHLAVNIIDRYTSNRVVFKRHYQLLGCTALWIAAKYEEAKDKVPTLLELKAMCCDSYNEKLFLQMEFHVLRTLDWQVGTATTDQFLQVMLTVPEQDDTAATLHLARLLSEISLFHREFLCFRPNQLAEGTLLFARQVLEQRLTSLDSYPVGTEDVVDALARHAGQLSRILANKYDADRYDYVARRLARFCEQARTARLPFAGSLFTMDVSATCTARHALSPEVPSHQQQQTSSRPVSSSSAAAASSSPSKHLARARQQPPSKLTVTPIRPGHIYAHGMITPPADEDTNTAGNVVKQQQQALPVPSSHPAHVQAMLMADEEEEAYGYGYATSEPALSPVSSACSILDAYHQPPEPPRYPSLSLA